MDAGGFSFDDNNNNNNNNSSELNWRSVLFSIFMVSFFFQKTIHPPLFRAWQV